MRHYEIVFLVHPDQSDQTQSILSKFASIVTKSGGSIHRSEDVGRRKLAYPIQDQFKASYALLNVECNQEAIDEIKSSFKFNDSIIRDLILVSKKAHTELSALSSLTREEGLENYGENREETYSKENPSKEKKNNAVSKEIKPEVDTDSNQQVQPRNPSFLDK